METYHGRDGVPIAAGRDQKTASSFDLQAVSQGQLPVSTVGFAAAS
jgi:hypothetical protein